MVWCRKCGRQGSTTEFIASNCATEACPHKRSSAPETTEGADAPSVFRDCFYPTSESRGESLADTNPSGDSGYGGGGGDSGGGGASGDF